MKTFVLISAAALLLSACTQQKEEAMKTSRERDSLVSVINQRDLSLNDFLAVNNEIERNLDSVVIREGAITMGMLKESELKPSAKDRLNADITAINDLMKKNRKRINELSSKLKNTNSKLAGYDKMIEQLNARVSDKDKELMSLNDKLSSLHMEITSLETCVTDLTAENTAQSMLIDQQTKELHTAYYIIGKSKELRAKKIISKTGGLLGIGKTSQIDPNINNSNFTRIDYTKVNDIDLTSNGAKIITAHPNDSYSIDKTHNLLITNPEKFWSASKYLVVISD